MRQEYINIYQTEAQLIGCHQTEVLLPTLEQESISCGFVPYIPYAHLHPSLAALALALLRDTLPAITRTTTFPVFPKSLHTYRFTTTLRLPLPSLPLAVSLFPCNYPEFLPYFLEQPPVPSPQLEGVSPSVRSSV